MARIYKTSDRIKVKVDGLVFIISPLSFDQKAEIQALAASGDLYKGLQAAKLAVKYAVKDVEGLKDGEGEYQPQLQDNILDDQSLDDIFNLEQNEKLAFACLNLLQSIPKEFMDPHTGNKLEGVSFVKESSGKKK